ncbi:MAG: tetratricopeptide repeat protein [Acidobacteriia bacterium]|nr:tetratricopeptide repeat protein [Terriglobia bacterium]
MSSRADTLRSLIEQDPTNSRFRYMLAIETMNGGNLEDAVQAFRDLLAVDPNYAAGYFQGAQSLEKLGRIEEAKALYREGIEVTTRSGDMHTRSELQGALDMLG